MKRARHSERQLTVRTRTFQVTFGQYSGANRAGLSRNTSDLSWWLSCNHIRVKQPLISSELLHAAEEHFRVLVADDQAAITHALELLLRSAGMEVLVASSPAEVMAQIAKGRFDLLLMDMNYGRDTTSGQEGLDLIGAVRKHDSDLRIVVMTAWSTIDLAVASLQHGAADFLQKPWENDAALRIVERQAVLTREQRARTSRVLRDNEDALEVQQALMGAAQKDYGRFSIAGATRAAHLVGGDYFDTFAITDEQFAFCIADSMGKGTGAALAMANFQALLRTESLRAGSTADVCSALNRRMFDSRLQRLTTMFFGVVNKADGLFTYTNAGHSPAFLMRKNGQVERLQTEDALLGAIPSWQYHESSVRLEAGDRLLAVTDGLLEATDQDGRELGEEGLLRRALASRHQSVAEMLKLLLEDTFVVPAEGLRDDTTALLLEVN
jgi:phosphoserine phosphatase RsbU/P